MSNLLINLEKKVMSRKKLYKKSNKFLKKIMILFNKKPNQINKLLNSDII